MSTDKRAAWAVDRSVPVWRDPPDRDILIRPPVGTRIPVGEATPERCRTGITSQDLNPGPVLYILALPRTGAIKSEGRRCYTGISNVTGKHVIVSDLGYNGA